MLGDILALKKRFCKDKGLPINVFESPYFESRLQLFGAWEDYCAYMHMVESMGGAEQYLHHYNQVKDAAINYIKESDAYKLLQSSGDFFQAMKKPGGFSGNDVYKEHNVGHEFVSIDMRKANFTALVHFGRTVGQPFFEDYNYRAFMRQFTDVEHIIGSKYIRQVIFGNCNPKRQIAYESYLMGKLLQHLLDEKLIERNDVHSLMSDEIILKVDGFSDRKLEAIEFEANACAAEFPLKFEFFKLGRILGSGAYIKHVSISEEFPQKYLHLLNWDGSKNDDPSYVVKCVSPDEAPFVYRQLKKEQVTEEDMVFVHEGKLARFLNAPELGITWHEITQHGNTQGDYFKTEDGEERD